MKPLTLSDYLRLPWTITRTEGTDDGHYIVLEVRELPGFLVAARTESDAERQFWPALEAFLASYTDAGEEPPVPEAMLPMRPQLELIPEPAPASVQSAHFSDGVDYRTKLSGHSRFVEPLAG